MGLGIPFFEDVVEPALKGNGYAPSGRLRDFFAGNCTPGDLFLWPTRQVTGGIVDIFSEPIQEEFKESMDYLFDQKMNPTIDKVNYCAEQRIKQGEDAAKGVVREAASNFKDVIREGEESAIGILERADEAYKDNLRLTFQQINGAVSEAILGLRATIGQVDTVFEKGIRQASDALMECIAKANQFPGLIRTNLIDPTFDRLERFEATFFRHIDHILEELGKIILGAQAQIDILRQMIGEWFPNPFDSCRIKYHVQFTSAFELTVIKLYRLLECRELRDLNQHISTLKVKDIGDTYASLQSRAWLFSCYERGSDAARDNYLRDWVKYGRLYKLWKY